MTKAHAHPHTHKKKEVSKKKVRRFELKGNYDSKPERSRQKARRQLQCVSGFRCHRD